ncbi:MAG TPA: antitoxin [Candidatus Cloacimonetes bacterium]|nr:antitoxin [Candidatus Cloacimonadota bacterium]
MKNNFDKDDMEILKSFENGEWRTSGNIEKRSSELRLYARNTIKKDKRVNIRISSRDLKELQRKAIQEGLPYQTFISSILHKFVNGKFRYQE